MFDASGDVEPKLTEISFCPANNAVGDNHERDEELYRNYNNDIFKCMFLNECSDTITKLQWNIIKLQSNENDYNDSMR